MRAVADGAEDPRTVRGRIDEHGRLVAADPELEMLQRDAGAELGQQLALPQVRAIVELAARLGTAVERPARAASSVRDYQFTVHAIPGPDGVELVIDRWRSQAAAPARLGDVATAAPRDSREEVERLAWSCDSELQVDALSPGLARRLGVGEGSDDGRPPLTRLLQLVEDEDGNFPLLAALASRGSFDGQKARLRGDPSVVLTLAASPRVAKDGAFAGFDGTATLDSVPVDESAAPTAAAASDDIDRILRSPLDRIIASAEKIVERGDGPLRRDYADYGNDIAAAARHLITVLQSMGAQAESPEGMVELTSLAAEAAVMLEGAASDAGVEIALPDSSFMSARGDENAIIQILVNLIGNAIRHSPAGEAVRVDFASVAGRATVTVSDRGPGIAEADRARVFQPFERGGTHAGGTGLGLAIARRLAQSMGGDLTLDSAPGEGARFTLSLPAA